MERKHRNRKNRNKYSNSDLIIYALFIMRRIQTAESAAGAGSVGMYG